MKKRGTLEKVTRHQIIEIDLLHWAFPISFEKGSNFFDFHILCFLFGYWDETEILKEVKK